MNLTESLNDPHSFDRCVNRSDEADRIGPYVILWERCESAFVVYDTRTDERIYTDTLPRAGLPSAWDWLRLHASQLSDRAAIRD